MTVTRDHTGAYCISQVVSGRLLRMRYLGYTRREAIKLFRAEVSDAKRNG